MNLSDVVVTPMGTKYSAYIIANGGPAPYRFRKCPTCPWGTANPINNLVAGTYTFGVKDGAGCTAEITKVVGPGPVGQERFSGEMAECAIRVFPNPANDGNVWVDLPGFSGQKVALRLVSSTGKVAFESSIGASSETVQLDLGAFASGLYSLDITSDTGERAIEKLSIVAPRGPVRCA